MSAVKFLYFDLGNVLVEFSVERMARQIGEVAGIDAAEVIRVLSDQGLQRGYETGHISTEQFYETFCKRTGTRPNFDALLAAGSHIFELNVSMLPVVAQLDQAGYRMGILSNTCASHWQYLAGRFRILALAFEVHALSYEIGAVKPEASIFQTAAELAGAKPEEIFFVDDTPGHVTGAKAAGFDAVQYTSTAELVRELRERGVRFNY